MILFVDETENESFFIVAGLLLQSREDAITIFSHFKHSIKNFPISEKKRSRLFTEFKSNILDRDYTKVKFTLLEELSKQEYSIAYSCFYKKGLPFPQSLKETMYINLLSNIILSIDNEVDIIFDSFGKHDFEDKIISQLSANPNVKNIAPEDSQKEVGLQLVDNICSVIRKNKSNIDKDHFYSLIKDNTFEV